jgi:Phage capsid protein
MAITAPQIQYRDEFIAGFEAHQALLRNTCTTEVVIKGNQATFLVVDSGSASAVTRGVNGLIPARNDNNNQYTATLVEWHDLVQKTGFNIFQSQGDQRAAMQMTSRGVLNRRIDADILTELANGTQDTGAATTMSLALALRAKTILGNAEVPFDGGIYAVISPAAEAYLLMSSEFSSADYVPVKPLASGETAFADTPKMYSWMGVNWIVHPNVSGVGTNAEKCFMFHKNAIGHAINTGDLMTAIGYDEEQDYSFARASAFTGAKLLQNTGIVVINHDGSALVAE